jgi:ribosomal protein S18 acetylase RimI-like enzyme
MYPIRRIQKEDLKTVKKLSDASLPESYSVGLLKKLINAWPEACLVTESQDGVIGFIIGRKDGTKSRIVLICVDTEFRKKGVGSELLNRYLEIMKRQRFKTATLLVEVSNQQAIDFYLHRRFKIKEKKPHIYKNGSDAYLMERAI